MSGQANYDDVQIYDNFRLKPLQQKPELEQEYASLEESQRSESEFMYTDRKTINQNPTQATAVKSKEGKPSSDTCLRVSAAIAIVIACLALVGVIIVAGVYVIGLQENNVTLTNQIMKLEAKVNMTQGDQTLLVMAQQQVLQSVVNGLNDTRNEFNNQLNSLLSSVNTTTTQLSSLQSSVDTLTTARGTTTTQLSSLQSSVDTLTTARGTTTTQLSSLQSSVDTLTTARGTTMTQLSSLQSSVNTLTTARGTTTTQLSSLQSSVDTLTTARDTTTTQLSSLQSSVDTLTTARDTTTTQLSSLQSSVSTLTTRVNSINSGTAGNPFQNCIQESRSCNLHSGSSFRYWTSCTTSSLSINSTGYYTLDIRCEFEIAHDHLVAPTLYKSGSNVYCRCDATRRPSQTENHIMLVTYNTNNSPGICRVFVSRCPM